MKPIEKALNKIKGESRAVKKNKELERRSKEAGFYVHGHKNLGDVYEP